MRRHCACEASFRPAALAAAEALAALWAAEAAADAALAVSPPEAKHQDLFSHGQIYKFMKATIRMRCLSSSLPYTGLRRSVQNGAAPLQVVWFCGT